METFSQLSQIGQLGTDSVRLRASAGRWLAARQTLLELCHRLLVGQPANRPRATVRIQRPMNASLRAGLLPPFY
jgi:hypothetical protein